MIDLFGLNQIKGEKRNNKYNLFIKLEFYLKWKKELKIMNIMTDIEWFIVSENYLGGEKDLGKINQIINKRKNYVTKKIFTAFEWS